jgi:hypothetical protein
MSLVKLADAVKSKLPFFPKSAAAADKEGDVIFRKTVENLMKPKVWTFGAFRHYNEKSLELLGGTGFKGWIQKNQKNPVLDQTRLKIKILSCMNPFELSSNHKSVFTPESIRALAESSGATEEDVKELIKEHDILRGDRRWYQIRLQFRRDLPRSIEEKEILAKRDRPLSETEKDLNEKTKDFQLAQMKQRKNYTPPARRPHHQFSNKSATARKWSENSVRLPGKSPWGEF